MKVRVLLNHQIQILFSNYFKKIKKKVYQIQRALKTLLPRGCQKERQKLMWEKIPIIYHQEDARREKLTTYIVTFPNPPLNKMR